MSDPYLRFMLTIIAGASVVIALQTGASPVPAAHAAEQVECRFSGPLEIKGPIEIKGVDRTVQVELKQAYGEPGSSSSNPVYVRSVP